MRSIEISAYKSFELYIEKDPFTNEWTLSLIARYEKKDISRPHPDITTQGFYLIKLERCAIIFTNRDSSEICSIQAYIDKVWHSTNSPSFKLKAKITPFALQEIYQKTKGQNLMVRWDISGYGFPHERERNYYGRSLINIEATNLTPLIYPKEDFIKNILEKVDLFKRAFIEIKIPTKEAISNTSKEFQPLANLLMERFVYLEESLKKLYDATISREYAESIGDIRKTLGSVETQMSHINDIMAEKLFLDLGTFTGKGALKQSKASIAHIRKIITGITNLASGMGIHLETKEKTPIPYIPHPDYHDAQYILFTSILTLGYLSEKLQKYNVRVV